MTKTRIQSNQRPHAKGKHQRTGQRAEIRENPPTGLPWGQKNWTGTGGGVTVPYALLTWEQLFVAPPGNSCIRANQPVGNTVTHVYISETYLPGGVGDPLASLANNDPLRLYNSADLSQWIEYKVTAQTDAGPYRDYTVTYTATGGGGWAPFPSMGVLIVERTGSPSADPAAFDPTDHTIIEVQDHVNALAMDDQRAAIIQAILDLERANKNRSTLETWLDQQLGVV